MNVVEMESPFVIQAKTIGDKKRRNVIYSIENFYHSTCIDKRGIVLGQVDAFERVLLYRLPKLSAVFSSYHKYRTAYPQ